MPHAMQDASVNLPIQSIYVKVILFYLVIFSMFSSWSKCRTLQFNTFNGFRAIFNKLQCIYVVASVFHLTSFTRRRQRHNLTTFTIVHIHACISMQSTNAQTMLTKLWLDVIIRKRNARPREMCVCAAKQTGVTASSLHITYISP